jgi:hypothetical protein
MEILLDKVNQNIQEVLKKFQDTKNKEYEKTQKQINEIIGALNKHKSETENTINTEINKVRTKINNIKEVVTHDMENLRKKNETETQNTMEGHSNRLEQAEDRISELEDEMVIKGKTEELLVRQLKSCERNMQKLAEGEKLEIYQGNSPPKQAGVAIIISDKINFKVTLIKQDKEGHSILIKGEIHQKEITIINLYAPNVNAHNFIKHTLEDLKAYIDSNTVVVGDFNTPYHK